MSVLAVHPGALGDLILFGHLLKATGQPVTLVAGGEKARLLAGLGAVAKAMDFDALPMHEVFAAGPVEQGRLPALIGRHEALVSCFAGGNHQAELALAAMCEARRAVFLPVRPPPDFPGHLLDLWTQRLGIPPIPMVQAPWTAPPEWQAKAAALLSAAGVAGPYVVLHPGAGGQTKRWPLEDFLELAGALRRDARPTVVWVLGPVERERWTAGEVHALAREGVVLPPLGLADLAGVIVGAAGFVGNDSGPAHLAAAVGSATVVVTTPASWRRFAPLGRHVACAAGEVLADVTVHQVRDVLAGLASGR